MADETNVPQGEEKETPKGEENTTPKGEEKETPKGEEKETPKGKGKGKDKPAKEKSTEVESKKDDNAEASVINLNPYFVRAESLIWANENGLQVHQFDYTKNQSITTSGFKTEVKSYGSHEECQKDALAKSYKTDAIVVVNRRIMEICTKRLKDKGLTLEYLNKDADSKEAKGFMIDLA